MKWWSSPCAPGDMIRIRLGAICHYGIFVSEREVIAFGEPPATPEILRRPPSAVRVIATDVDTFACGQMIEVAQMDKAEKKARFAPEKTIALARGRLGEGGYNLIHNNCEHFVYECVFGIKKSTQEDEARDRWRHRPLLDVYIARIPDEVTISRVTPARRELEIAVAKNARVRKEKFYVWQLLAFAVHESLGYRMDELTLKKTANGQWVCGELCLSLTHTDGFCAAAVSESPVGIDAENLDVIAAKHTPDSIEKLLRHALCEGETCPPTPAAFTSLWTRKEAVFKSLGEKTFLPTCLSLEGRPVRTDTFDALPGLVLSVCGKETARTVFRLWDGADGCSLLFPKAAEDMTR